MWQAGSTPERSRPLGVPNGLCSTRCSAQLLRPRPHSGPCAAHPGRACCPAPTTPTCPPCTSVAWHRLSASPRAQGMCRPPGKAAARAAPAPMPVPLPSITWKPSPPPGCRPPGGPAPRPLQVRHPAQPGLRHLPHDPRQAGRRWTASGWGCCSLRQCLVAAHVMRGMAFRRALLRPQRELAGRPCAGASLTDAACRGRCAAKCCAQRWISVGPGEGLAT